MNICIYKHNPRVDVTLRILEAYQRAFESLGHKVLLVSHDMGNFTTDRARAFALEFVNFKADLALCYGFSAMPHISGGYFFRKHGIPLMILCFENPFFGLHQDLVEEIKTHQEYYHFYVWDAWYLDQLRTLFTNCHPIRHAAEVLNSASNPLEPSPAFDRELAFVGNIPYFVQMRKERLEANSPFNPIIDRLLHTRMQSPGSNPFDLLLEFLENDPGIYGEKPASSWTDPLLHQEVIFPLYAEGLGRHRYTLLNRLDMFRIDYFGDLRWQAPHITFHPSVAYFQELPRIYRSTVVNLDIPPFQSIDSINNRFFDVGASGSLLLTEKSNELISVFPACDSITYRSFDELKERIRFYLDHPAERNQKAEELYRCVAGNHTYEHRVPYLMDTTLTGLTT